MEMQSVELNIFALLKDVNQLIEFMLRDTKFILIQTSCDIFVSVGIDIRIDSHRDSCLYSVNMRHLIDDIDFL